MKTQENNQQANESNTPRQDINPSQIHTTQQPDRDRVASGTQTDYRERTTQSGSITTSAPASSKPVDNDEEISNRDENDENTMDQQNDVLEGDDEWDENDTMGDDRA